MPHLTAGRVATYFILGVWSIVCLFPVYWLVITAFKSGADVERGPYFLPFLDFMPGLDAWRFVLIDSGDKLLGRFFNSCVIAAAPAALALLIGSMAVYALTRFNYRLPWNKSLSANRLLMSSFLATRVLPPVVVILPLLAFSGLVQRVLSHAVARSR